MLALAKVEECPFYGMCEECHPESAMQKKRETCNDENCHDCLTYWAFHDGYYALDEE